MSKVPAAGFGPSQWQEMEQGALAMAKAAMQDGDPDKARKWLEAAGAAQRNESHERLRNLGRA